MTTVEDAPAVVHEPEHRIKILERPKETTGAFSWVTTVDHKKIAIMYATLALFFFMVGGIEAFLVGEAFMRASDTGEALQRLFFE